MKTMTRLYPTQPVHGDRFARMWRAYYAPKRGPWLDRLLTVSAVVIGVCAAWWM